LHNPKRCSNLKFEVVNLHQFRYVQEAVRRKLNLTDVSRALNTSQPGVSKAILELEEELGIEIFVRHGKRLRGVTEPGEQVLQAIDRILREVANLRRLGEEFAHQDAGTLSVATTHTQARYVLPQPIAKLREMYPKVSISLHQGAPDQVARMLIEETAEVGIATESLADYPELITLPCYDWQHMLVIPAGHALANARTVSLADLAALPIVTYHPSFTGRTKIDAAFAQRKLKPNIALEAIDSDVITTYARLGLGIGIVAEMAVRDLPDAGSGSEAGLVKRPAGKLFGTNTARLAFKRGVYMRGFLYQFAELLSERLDRKLIDRALKGDPDAYDL
jgi:LysR family transcriptional regulator, cys regulon transcriptional activator